jgi:hypothetical protein
MPHIKILNKNDIKAFDSPPVFNSEDRKKLFYLPKWGRALVESFRTPTNKIGFILQFGYFKAVDRFFTARKFHQNDIEYIAKRLGLGLNELDFENYKERSFIRHQELILKNTGILRFNQNSNSRRNLNCLIIRSKSVW